MEEKENLKEERIKEEIRYRTELIKLLAVFLLTAIGGEISLFLFGNSRNLPFGFLAMAKPPKGQKIIETIGHLGNGIK